MRKAVSALLALVLAAGAHAQVTDAFNGTNGADLTGWTDLAGAGLQYSATNTARAAGGSGNDDGSQHNTTMSTNDHYVEVDLVVPGGLSGNNYYSLLVRMSGETGAARDGYACSFGTASDYYITEITNGSGSDLDMGTQAIANGNRVRCDVGRTTPNEICLYVTDMDTPVNCVVDGSPKTGTTVGLQIFNGAAQISEFDNFEADDLGGGGGGGTVVNPITGLGGGAAQPVD